MLQSTDSVDWQVNDYLGEAAFHTVDYGNGVFVTAGLQTDIVYFPNRTILTNRYAALVPLSRSAEWCS